MGLQRVKNFFAHHSGSHSCSGNWGDTVGFDVTLGTFFSERCRKTHQAKFGGGVAENQGQNLQASVTWTTQRADASTVEALRDIARGIVTRLNSNTLPPERAISALDALKDVDMSLELLELSPIASAVSAIAEDGCCCLLYTSPSPRDRG